MAHINYAKSFQQALENHVGETGTIFTGSGGQSGCGFTGVILYVNESYVRLLIKMGSMSGCALKATPRFHSNNNNRSHENVVYSTGSLADIPLDKIVCFVHNTI